jgi:hypothetical protein
MIEESGPGPLTNGSGSRRPKNIRIRIPNTGYSKGAACATCRKKIPWGWYRYLCNLTETRQNFDIKFFNKNIYQFFNLEFFNNKATRKC